MPEEKPADDVEKFLTEQKSMEERKRGLIDDLLKQKEAVMMEFDEKLAKLGYRVNSAGRSKRNHHKKPAALSGASAQTRTTGKAKA